MPALVLFGRRWQIGSDDLVLPSIVDLLFRLSWLLATAIIFWRNEDELNCFDAKVFLIGYLGIVHISVILDATLIQNSRCGSIMETDKRTYVPFFIYLRILNEMIAIGWNIWGTVWQWNQKSNCLEPVEANTLIYYLIIFNWSSLFIQLLSLIYCFDPLGASKSQTQPYKDPTEYFKEFPNIDVPFGKTKYSKRWENYWKCLSVSWLCWHKRKSDEMKDTFREIAKIFATELGDHDLVHSDIVCGLILLAAKHKENARRIRQAKAERSRQVVKHASMDVIEEEPMDWNPAETENKDFHTSDAWRSPNYLAHFLKYACAPFGWVSVVLDRGDTFSRLLKLPRCCSSNRYPFEVLGDNCCYTNTAGLVDLLQVELNDIIHVSFKNKVYNTPFFVALDHEKKSIVVSIRGTLSFTDFMVDMTGWPVPIPGCPEAFKAHHGFLMTSLKLKKKLDDLHILPKLLKTHPGYQLIITGHSLGAGCGTVLSIMLKKQYPTLKCYAFAPPGGLLSKAAAEFCNDFLTSVAYGDDVVTRLGIVQFERLKLDMLAVLTECEIPKYQILLQSVICCSKGSREFKFMSRTDSSKSTQKLSYNNTDGDVSIIMPNPNPSQGNNDDANGLQVRVFSKQTFPETRFPYIEGMYPPGKIFYISKTHKFNLSYSTWREPVAKYTWRWADRTEFDDIIISKRMIIDHIPIAMPEALHYLTKP